MGTARDRFAMATSAARAIWGQSRGRRACPHGAARLASWLVALGGALLLLGAALWHQTVAAAAPLTFIVTTTDDGPDNTSTACPLRGRAVAPCGRR